MFGDAFMGNDWRCIYGKCVKMHLWEMFGDAFMGNVWKCIYGKCLEMHLWEMFGDAFMGNVQQMYGKSWRTVEDVMASSKGCANVAVSRTETSDERGCCSVVKVAVSESVFLL